MECLMATGSIFLSTAAAAADEPPVNATNWHILEWSLVFGLFAAAAVVAFAALPFRLSDKGMRFPGGAAFSAKDSWATTLTELVAAVGIAGAAFADKFTGVVDAPYAAE